MITYMLLVVFTSLIAAIALGSWLGHRQSGEHTLLWLFAVIPVLVVTVVVLGAVQAVVLLASTLI